jgi:hypothetical protein
VTAKELAQALGKLTAAQQGETICFVVDGTLVEVRHLVTAKEKGSSQDYLVLEGFLPDVAAGGMIF